MNQQPLFVYVPTISDRQVKEAAPVSEISSAEATKTNIILPELLDRIHSDFADTLSEKQHKRFNGRLERALLLAKQGLVRVSDDAGIFSVKGSTGPQAWYKVDLNTKTCECPDHKAGNTCKHRVASWYIQQALFQVEADQQQVDQPSEEIVQVFVKNYNCDAFVYGDYMARDGSDIPVEILELDTVAMTAFVRALPVPDENGRLVPVFPFPSPFEASSVLWSSAAVAFDELADVKIYRYKEDPS